mgnify:CR=1 FL=1
MNNPPSSPRNTSQIGTDWSTDGIIERRDTFYAASQRAFVPYEEPMIFKSGKGQYLWDEAGKRYLDLLGMNVRQCVTVKDAKKGTGFKMVTREIMLYLDPKTGKLLENWKNPLTGDTVEVVHVANDPVNMPVDFGVDRNGKPLHFTPVVLGNTWQLSMEFPLFYHNALGGNYQKYVGNHYHATEIFDFYGQYDDLLDSSKDSHASRVAWVRLSSWLPWMEMGGRAGSMYFNAQGGKLNSWDELPQVMKDQIHKNYPAYTNAPPADDTRPNESSWTYFKKVFDERAKNDKGANKSQHGGH